MKGILGRKLGMTQVFLEDGTLMPVTVVEAGPCCVVQAKTVERDGYEGITLGFEEIKKEKKNTKPMKGFFDKTGTKQYKVLKEFRMSGLNVGEMANVDVFSPGEKVAVTGVSKGKGFQGVMKRYHYSGGPGSHGSMFNRAPGSIGQSAFPSRVWKNKGMPGRMGLRNVCIKNLAIIDVKPDQNILILKGAVPGAKGSILTIKKA